MKSALTKEDIPIEPLSEASWNRLETALFEELDDRARVGSPRNARLLLPRWAAVALAAAVVLQGAVAALVLLRHDDAPEQLASARLVSEHEASDHLLGDVAVHLEPASALVVVADAAHGSLCVLERGAARFSVPHRGARPAFVVQAGDARVEVIGTRFRVERAAGSAVVETYEGKVRVDSRGQTRFVARGQRWSGAPRPESHSQPASANPVPAAGVPSAQPASAQPAAIAPNTRSAVLTLSEQQRARFEQAAAREASDPQHALRIYRSLAQEAGPWAQNALYAAGRLELELGHPASAQRVLRSYLERHPGGANAADARALLQRLTPERKKVER